MSWRILALGLAACAALVFTLALGLVNEAKPETSAIVGRPAPRLELASARDGAPVSLESLRGKPAVVNFWATWCAACKEEHPTLQRAALSLRGLVTFVGVASDADPEAVRRYLEEHGAEYANLLDPESKAASAWGAVGLPTTFFLDAQGVVVDQVQGPVTGEVLIEKLRPLFEAAPQ